MDIIKKYFPDLTADQIAKFDQLQDLYRHWNEQINVISRKDIDQLYERHVLHSLGIAKVMAFQPGAKVMDVGCGGGFPGIPLAILFPETEFYLVDSIGKKIKVVNAVAEALALENLKAEHIRAEKVKDKFDFVVSRAVTQMSDFTKWVRKKFKTEQNHPLPNGILYLKGGDLGAELAPFGNRKQLYDLSDYFEEGFFETKKVVHIKMS